MKSIVELVNQVKGIDDLWFSPSDFELASVDTGYFGGSTSTTGCAHAWSLAGQFVDIREAWGQYEKCFG